MDFDKWEKQLRLILKNRLSTRKSSRYLAWIASQYSSELQGDHIAKKSMDLLIAKRKPSEHLYNEYDGYTDNFIQALENLFDYVKYLEGINESNN